MASRATRAEISLHNIRHNFQLLKSRVGAGAFFCPMVKADAYGHGDGPVAHALVEAGADCLGVVTVEEAVRLREAGVACSICVFGGFRSEAIKDVLHYRLTPVVSDWEQLYALNTATPHHISLHIKVNTGMNRLGFQENEKDKLVSFLLANRKLHVTHVCTHFLSGADANEIDGYTSLQMRSFADWLALFPASVSAHAMNSAALMSWPINQKNPIHSEMYLGARPGIAIYGYSPLDTSTNIPIKPAMQLKTEVEMVKKIKRGQVVSYNARWIAQRDSVIGVLPIGYADGWFRTLTNKSSALVMGRRVPMIGTVCMDFCMVDLTDIEQDPSRLQRSEVVLFGEQAGETISVHDVSQLIDTISYEVVTRIGKRVPRVYEG